ncbi:hypothetical protein GCM10009809_36550 [Isoptericola hypogeus]|uniref:Helix-hairpin-helix DNA-binding motif class 1 domain-containing protein n=1 Tax=Isoptericola hypogeus TaxID=300179 RepID=A0ABN2JV73_9MICO
MTSNVSPFPAPDGAAGGPPGDLADDPDDGPAADDLAAAASRFRAWHATAAGPALDDVAPDGPGVATDGVVGARDPDGTDDLAGRLRARREAGRTARHVAAAYSAAHGHPLAADDGADGRRRWSLRLRTAIVAAAAVLLVAVGASVVALLRPDDVITLAGTDAGSDVGAVGSPGPSAAGAPVDAAASGSSVAEAEGDDPEAGSAVAASPGQAVVHVVGEVREPGLVTVPADARVADAVEAAGGPTRQADTAALNLARAVVDGEQIVVPEPGEAVPGGGASSSGDADADGVGASGTAGAAGGVLDLNTAQAPDLDALPGIGPVLAERIVAWRDDNGSFTSVDELEEVSGIGPSVLEQVRDLVRV